MTDQHYENKEFIGRLPLYAKTADRRRVVKILCKGNCMKTELAEMTVDYPGARKLKEAQAGDYKARCLKCGYIARDPYNWDR